MAIYKSAQGEQAVRERYLKSWSAGPWRTSNSTFRPARERHSSSRAANPEGPPVILLHGGAANSVMWMSDIAAWAPEFRIFAADVIGESGLSTPARPALNSDDYGLWLDDVMGALSLARASFIGVSLGGWLALDYATRRPERVASLVAMCPGGVGRQKIGIALKIIPLRLRGRWGKHKAREIVLGRAPAGLSPGAQCFMDFLSLIYENFRPRWVKMAVFSDEYLKRLTMPVLAILGGKDVLLDSAETKRRLERTVPHAEIRYYPEMGHFIPGQTTAILEFLRRSAAATVSGLT